MREAVEEVGAHIVLKGVLSVESGHRGAWRRVIFYAEMVDEDEVCWAYRRVHCPPHELCLCN